MFKGKMEVSTLSESLCIIINYILYQPTIIDDIINGMFIVRNEVS